MEKYIKELFGYYKQEIINEDIFDAIEDKNTIEQSAIHRTALNMDITAERIIVLLDLEKTSDSTLYNNIFDKVN